MECFLIPPGFWEVANASDAARRLRAARNLTPGRFIAADRVRVDAVAGDGNCFFEAAHRGFKHLWRTEYRASDSRGLRASVVSFIAGNPEQTLNGLPLSEWLMQERNLSPAEYRAEMSKPPHGLAPSTWAGALEMGVLCNIYGCRVLTWELVREGYELVNEALPDDGSGHDVSGRTISIVWSGLHYNVLFIDAEDV